MNLHLTEESISLTNKMKLVFVLILAVFVVNMSIPQTVKAQSILSDKSTQKEYAYNVVEKMDLLTERFVDHEYGIFKMPEDNTDVIKTYTVVATAYSSTVDQCDSTPCITASGLNVCNQGLENVIAANFLPFGTKVKIPELYGDKIFTVEDRMNPRYDYRIDLWKTSRNRAISFGKRLVKIEIVK